jgi:hypothetical protein
MKITKQQLYDAHELFNNYFFAGMLNHPKFIVSKKLAWYDHTYESEEYDYYEYLEAWGYYKHPGLIAITTNKYWYITLLHEMIHQYQYEFDLKDKDHGKLFHSFARYMEKTLKLEKNTVTYIKM